MPPHRKRFFMTTLFCVSMFLLSSAWAQERLVLLATTTSTDNTGLLDYLSPRFTAATGITLRWTSTGTGKALKLGENCDVDVLIVHAPEAEMKFVSAGFGEDRRPLMVNDFVLIGPKEDPARIKGLPVTDALKAIRNNKGLFVSRGDDSGTHKKEKFLWKTAGINPPALGFYLETGQGMLASLTVATEKKAYTMTDRGTYIKYETNDQGDPELIILVEKDPLLINPYSVIAINPENCPGIRYTQAKAFIDWITGPEAQDLIRDFKLMGKPLFIPTAGK